MSTVNHHVDRENDTVFTVTHHDRDRGEDFFVVSIGFWPLPNELRIFVNHDQLTELARVVNAALKAHPAPAEPLDAETEAGLLRFAQEERARRGIAPH